MINYWNAIGYLIFLGAMCGVSALINRAAKRYGAGRIAEGEWDENGPKHPTAPKRWEHVSSNWYIGLHLDDEPPAPEPHESPPLHTSRHHS